MTPLLLVMFFVLGMATGFLAGMLGIGGGILLVPFLAWAFAVADYPTDHVLHIAVATSLATILFTSASSIRAHHRHGAVRWDLVQWMGSGALVGTFAGAQVASRLGTRWLALFFALFLGYTGINMLFKAHRTASPYDGPLPGGAILFGVGSGIGFVASLIGAGGGFLTVPFLGWRGVAIRESVASSAALGFAIAIGGLAGYIVAGWNAVDMPAHTIGYIDLPSLACCASASAFTAPFGVRAAHGMKPVTLKTIFATLLIGLACSMSWTAWQSWNR